MYGTNSAAPKCCTGSIVYASKRGYIWWKIPIIRLNSIEICLIEIINGYTMSTELAFEVLKCWYIYLFDALLL